MGLSVAKLAEYMKHGLNIYIFGEAGTGKTLTLTAAAKKAKLKMGYMSAPTLDAYVDLVGIPVAEFDETLKKKVLEFIRKKEFQDIEVLFIDELPRGELKTLNAIFEIIQFGTINGERAMPNLVAVVAAGNPMTDDYVGQQQLDMALLDRFDMYLETDTAADLPFFIETFGKNFGKALVDWHGRHDHKEKGYLSPRRLEKMGATWQKMPEIGTLKAMAPPGGDFSLNLLHKALVDASKGDKIQDDPAAPILEKITFMSDSQIRDSREELIQLLPTLNKSDLAMVTDNIARALKTGLRIDPLVENWSEALLYFSPADKTLLVANWDASRSTRFYTILDQKKIAIGKNLIELPTK